MAKVAIPVIYRQVGWMVCIACSDARKMKFGSLKGQMWLGCRPNGTDDFVDCPACGGTGEVPRYETINARTGERVDYEGRDENGQPIQVVPVGTKILGE